MRVFALCVVFALGTIAAGNGIPFGTISGFNDMQIRLIKQALLDQRNPTAAGAFAVAQLDFSDVMEYGLHSIVLVRNSTIPTTAATDVQVSSYENALTGVEFFAQVLEKLTERVSSRLEQEIHNANITVDVPKIGNPKYDDKTPEELSAIANDKFKDYVFNVKSANQMTQNFLRNVSDCEDERKIKISKINNVLREALSNLYDFREYTQAVFYKWHNTLMAYGTSTDPWVETYEQDIKESKDGRSNVFKLIFNTDV